MKLKTVAALFFFSLLACGIKGPPLPPTQEDTIQKQKGDAIVSNSSDISSADQSKAGKKKTKK